MDVFPLLGVEHGVFFESGHDQPSGAAVHVCNVAGDGGAETAAGVLEARFRCVVKVVRDREQ